VKFELLHAIEGGGAAPPERRETAKFDSRWTSASTSRLACRTLSASRGRTRVRFRSVETAAWDFMASSLIVIRSVARTSGSHEYKTYAATSTMKSVR